MQVGCYVIPLSHYTAITRSWRGDVTFLRAPWDRRKMQKIVAYYFSIFTPWRSHGVPTAIVAFLRRFHGVLSRSCGVLVGDRLRAHGVLMVCPRRAHRVLGAVTARARRAHGARTASTPFMPFRISIRIMLCLPAIVHVMSHSHQHSYHAVLPGN